MRRVLAVMHNSDEITRTTTRDCPACCGKIAQFNFQGDLQSNGPISWLVAASKSHFASVEKERDRLDSRKFTREKFHGFPTHVTFRFSSPIARNDLRMTQTLKA